MPSRRATPGTKTPRSDRGRWHPRLPLSSETHCPTFRRNWHPVDCHRLPGFLGPSPSTSREKALRAYSLVGGSIPHSRQAIEHLTHHVRAVRPAGTGDALARPCSRTARDPHPAKANRPMPTSWHRGRPVRWRSTWPRRRVRLPSAPPAYRRECRRWPEAWAANAGRDGQHTQ